MPDFGKTQASADDAHGPAAADAARTPMPAAHAGHEGYDPFAALAAWRGPDPDTRSAGGIRSWSLRDAPGGRVRCALTVTAGGGKWQVTKTALVAAEAVRLALLDAGTLGPKGMR